MILRFRILEPNNSGAPDYTICDQGTAVLDYTNTSLNVKVDGNVVINTANLNSTLGFTGAITTSEGNQVISASIENSDYITIQIDMPNKCSTANVEISSSKTDYYTYYNSYTIFNYDIGNNPNVNYSTGNPIADNPDFDIILVPKVISGVDITANCFSSFIGYRQPFTNLLYLYKNNSKPSNTSYFNSTDNETIASTSNTIVDICDDKSIKSISTCNLNSCGCSGSSSTSCESKNQTFAKYKFIPNWGIFVPSNSCNEECVIKGETNTAYANIDFSSLTLMFINDTQVNYFDDLTLTWELVTIDNAIADTVSFSIDTSVIPIAYNSNDTRFEFDPPTTEDYIIKAILEDECFECNKSQLVTVCDNINITVSNCNQVSVKSYSSEIKKIKVEKFISLTENQLIQDVLSLSLCETWSSELVDGIYIITVYDNADTEIGKKILHIWCDIKACLRKLILNVVCTKCTCDSVKKVYDFNALTTQLYTYFSIIQTVYDYNTLYEVLSTELLNDLVEITKFMTKFNEYCEECITGLDENPCNCG